MSNDQLKDAWKEIGGWLSRIICGDWCRMTNCHVQPGFWMFITFISRRLLRRSNGLLRLFMDLPSFLKPIRGYVALEVFVRQVM